MNKLKNQSGFISNNDTQKSIESLILDEFEMFDRINGPTYVSDINTELLSYDLNKYVIDKTDLINFYILKLKASYTENKITRVEQIFIGDVINTVHEQYILNLALTQFLRVYTYQNTDDDKYYNLINVSIDIGKKLTNNYLNKLRYKFIDEIESRIEKKKSCEYIEIREQNDFIERKRSISYSLWVDMWKYKNPRYKDIIEKDDSFYSELGCKIIDILDNSDMLKKVLIKSSRSVIKNHYILQRVDQRLLPIKDKHTIMSLPTKLPMVVKPKPFSDKQYGGYILNDVNYS